MNQKPSTRQPKPLAALVLVAVATMLCALLPTDLHAQTSRPTPRTNAPKGRKKPIVIRKRLLLRRTQKKGAKRQHIFGMPQGTPSPRAKKKKKKKVPGPRPHDLFQIKNRRSIAIGAYKIRKNKNFILVGHLTQGRISLFDIVTQKLLRSVSLGRGQTYIDMDETQVLVGLTLQRTILLLSLPSLRVVKRFKLSFYPYSLTMVPTAKGTSRHAIISDYLHNAITRLDLQSGKFSQRRTIPWPKYVKWTPKYGFVISALRHFYLFHGADWKRRSKYPLDQIVGEVALHQKTLAMVIGDAKKLGGDVRLHALPGFQKTHTHKVSPRPRSIGLTQKYAFSLSTYGILDVYNHQTRKLVQTTKYGISGNGLCTIPGGVVLLLPQGNEILFLQEKTPKPSSRTTSKPTSKPSKR